MTTQPHDIYLFGAQTGESSRAVVPKRILADQAAVFGQLARCDIEAGVLQFCATADAAPSAPGAYVLQVDIAENVLVTIAGRSPTELTAGRYLYCGSAKGPGGLRARLARHMRHGKSVHWHIDQLTERGIIIGSWIVPNGLQCELVAMLSPLPMPIPGFGSSDCRRCRSHLLYRPTGVSVPLTGFNEPHLDLDQQFSAGPSI